MSIDVEARARRRAEIEQSLARYPHLSPEGLAELTHWFNKEASSFDIAMIASNEAITEPYHAFRGEHIDPLRAKDWLKGLAFAAVVVALVVAMLWRAF